MNQRIYQRVQILNAARDMVDEMRSSNPNIPAMTLAAKASAELDRFYIAVALHKRLRKQAKRLEIRQ